MNLKMKKVFGVLLAVAMVVGSLNGYSTKKAEASGTVTPAKVTNYGTIPSDAQAYTVTLAADKNAYDITEINMKYKGVLELGYAAQGLADSIYFKLYSDVACTQEVGTSTYLSSTSLSDDVMYQITKAGTYYLKAYYSYYSSGSTNTVSMAALAYSGEGKTLNKNLQLTFNDTTTKVYHKIKVNKTGLVTIQGAEYSKYSGSIYSVSATLCNSKKSAIKSLYLSDGYNYTAYATLKKGTYYLAVESSNPYVLKATTAAKKNQAGNSKAKAKVLKKGKTASSYLTESDKANKPVWFKVKLSKKSKFKVKFTSRVSSNYSIYYKVVAANKNTYIYNSSSYLVSGSNTFTSKGKFSKGTYYIEVYKTSKAASGSFTVKNLSK